MANDYQKKWMIMVTNKIIELKKRISNLELEQKHMNAKIARFEIVGVDDKMEKELFKLEKQGITKDGHTMFNEDIVSELNGWNKFSMKKRDENRILLHEIKTVRAELDALKQEGVKNEN